MKKITRKLFISIIAVAFAFIALGTSTYAWFSMNTTVTVSNMELTAKSDNTYLLIGTVNNAATIQAITPESNATNVNVTFEDSEVYPSAPALDADKAALLPVQTYYVAEDQEVIAEEKEVGDVKVKGLKVDKTPITVAGAVVNDKASAAVVTNWYTATAASSDAPTMEPGSARQLTTFNGYVLTSTVYLTVAQGANPANNLKVSATITQKTGGNDVSAVKVIVATQDKMRVLSNNSGLTDLFDETHNTEINANGTLEVNIYVYYDGDAAPVYTNNMANLKGANISLAFTVDPITNNN